MPKKLILLVCALLLLPTMQAQKLLEFNPFDTTAYVYRLNKAQMDYLVQHNDQMINLDLAKRQTPARKP